MSGPSDSQIVALLTRALTLMNQGQWAFAEATLTQLLSMRPNDSEGLHLLGLVRLEQGRGGEAEALFRRSLAQKPKQPHVQISLGRLLAASGRAEEGIALLRSVVRAHPNHVEALLVLGQAQHAAGDMVFAEKNLRAARALAPLDPGAALSLGSLLSETGQSQEAETILRDALKREAPPPLRAGLEHNLGVALKMQRRYGEALTAFDAALRLAPGLPLAEYNRANALVHLRRNEDAVDGFRRYLVRDPANIAVHHELNALLYRMGRDDEFLMSFEDAAKASPLGGELLRQKAGLLVRIDRCDEALACFARATALQGEHPETLSGSALALANLGRFDESVSAYERSLALQPDNAVTKVNLAAVLLRAGEPSRALRLTEAVVPQNPYDQGALAVHELALRALDDPRAERLADYERHVQVFDLEPPAGFSSMAAFNTALNAHLDSLHTDTREHVDQTLRKGSQTLDSLFDGSNPLINALQTRIEEAVATYIANMKDGEAHPLAGRRRSGFDFPGCWSSRLYDHGFHTNHIHPKGWISSCYYVAVPDVVDDERTTQGWIKFGEPAFDMPLRDAVRRSVKPVPGRLVLFPSYMWHGTVAFHAPTARTTIAFDAIPA
jgi:tetratricopeptide (TPR) repeat protein